MAKKTMYAGINNSPQTTLAAQITAAAQSIAVASVDVFPAAPNLATIGTGDDAEVIQYNAISDGKLTGCVRGYGGTTAKVWSADTVIYRGFTLVDYNNLKDNIDDLYAGKINMDGNVSNTTAAFVAAVVRENIASGEKMEVIFGKIAKWFADLKAVAMSGSYDDLSNKPTSMIPSKHAESHKTGGTDAIAPSDIGAQPKISTSGILKGDGAGAITQAEEGTDYQSPIKVNGLLKGDGTGAVSVAVAGEDYAAAVHTHTTSDVEGLDEILNKPGLNAIFLDLSDANATAEDIAEGKIAYVANAQRVVGTASGSGIDPSNKPQILYSGKWSGWHIEFYDNVAYWEAVFYTSGTLSVVGTYSADIWGVGGGAFDYSGVMGNGAASMATGKTLDTGEIAVTVGAGASKNARGNGGNTAVGAVFTAPGGAMNVEQSGPFYRFSDSAKANEEGENGTSNGYAYGYRGWLHWRCGYDKGDGTGYGAGGSYGGYGNALVDSHPGVCIIRILV